MKLLPSRNLCPVEAVDLKNIIRRILIAGVDDSKLKAKKGLERAYMIGIRIQ